MQTVANQSDKIKAALMMVKALADAIREIGSIPSGHLYATVMNAMDLTEYDWIIDRLIGAKLVNRSGDVLRWIGPNLGQKHGPTG